MILTDLSTIKPKVAGLKNGPNFKIEVSPTTQSLYKGMLILFNFLYLKIVIYAKIGAFVTKCTIWQIVCPYPLDYYAEASFCHSRQMANKTRYWI